jgi:hypothetical protein
LEYEGKNMNKARKPKEHKKPKVKRLESEVKRLKAELYRTQYDSRAIIAGLHRKLTISERMAADAKTPVRWDAPPSLDVTMKIRSGEAKRFIASTMYDPHTREAYACREHFGATVQAELEQQIAHAFADLVPVTKTIDKRTGAERHLVDVYLLFAKGV